MTADDIPTSNSVAQFTPLKLRPWREVGVIGTMLMGLSWGIPWFRSLTQATNELSTTYAFFVFGSMMLGAYWFVRILNALRLRPGIRRSVLLVVLLASIFLGLKTMLFAEEDLSIADLTDRQLSSFSDAFALIPDEFIITVAVLLVWRRGTQLANEKIGPRLIQSAFAIGIAMFFAYIFFNTIITGESLGNMPTLFLSAGLMAMGAARVSVISTLRGGRDNPFDRRWMTGLVFSVAGAVGIASWLGGEISGGEGILGVLPRMLLGAALAVSFLVLTPIFMALYWLLYSTVSVLESENEFANRIGDAIGRLQGLTEGFFGFIEPYLGPLGDFLARFGLAAKAFILWVIVLLLFFIIIFAVYIQDSRKRARIREQYEKIAAEGLWKVLRNAVRNRAVQVAESVSGLFDVERRRRLFAAARVRKIYMDLMNLCADLNHPRPDAATPNEFVSAISDIFPEHLHGVQMITEAYERVRYGELPENRLEIERVENAWAAIRKEGEVLKKNHIAAA